MSWKPLAAFIGTALFLAGCRKDNHPAPNSNPTNYLLISMGWTNPYGDTGTTYNLTYNSAHLLTDYQVIQHGFYSYLSPSNDTTYYHLVYTNGRVAMQSVYNSQSPTYYWTYTYNSLGRLAVQSTYPIGGQSSTENYTYQYNNNGQLTDLWSTGPATGGLVYHNTYSYYSDGNLWKEVDSIPGQAGSLYEYTRYEKKVNIAKTLNGLPILTLGINPFAFSSSLSPNNVTGTLDGMNNADSSVYQYNEAGLPILQNEEGFIYTFTYAKY